MGLKKIVGFLQIVLSIAIALISFFIYYEANIKSSTGLSPALSLVLIIFGILIAIVMFLQGIVNIAQGKKTTLNKPEEAKGNEEKKEVKKSEKEAQPEPERETRRIGSSVKVLK